MRRIQGFASIRCDTGLINHIDDCALLTLMAKLSGAFTKDTALTIVLAPGAVLICGLAACTFMVLPVHICVHVGFAEDPQSA